MLNYKTRAVECLRDYEAENEFQINKIHKSITNRVIDYIFVLIVIYQQIFDEFISNFNLNNKVKDNKKYTKREQTLKMMNELTTKRRGTFMDTEQTNPKESMTKMPTESRFQTELEAPESQEETRSNSNTFNFGHESNGSTLVDFEERLKKCDSIKKLLVMSPSIPNGFDLNCTTIDVDDFSTVIC